MSSQPSDRVLVHVVKIQHLEDRIASLNDELLAALPTLNPAEDEARISRIVGLRNELEMLNRSSSELMHNRTCVRCCSLAPERCTSNLRLASVLSRR